MDVCVHTRLLTHLELPLLLVALILRNLQISDFSIYSSYKASFVIIRAKF